jgi:hypothetical protein
LASVSITLIVRVEHLLLEDPKMKFKFLVGAMVVASMSVTAQGEPPKPPKKGPPAEVATKARMDRHGAATMNLVRSVVLLDHKSTVRLARQIADDESLAGPPPPAAREKKESPELFSTFQRDLATIARRLSEGAAAKDDVEVAKAFSDLTKTCVLCHRNYLPQAR